jgi:hypothetical protein
MWSFVQAVQTLVDTAAGPTVTVTLPSVVASNRVFLAAYMWGGTCPGANTVTDSGGNPYLGPSIRITDLCSELSVWDTVVGADTASLVITVTASGTPSAFTVVGLEYSGLVPSLTDYLESLLSADVYDNNAPTAVPVTYSIGPSTDSATDGNLALAVGVEVSTFADQVNGDGAWIVRMNTTPGTAGGATPLIIQDKPSTLGQGETATWTEVGHDERMFLGMMVVKRWPQPDATRPLSVC